MIRWPLALLLSVTGCIGPRPAASTSAGDPARILMAVGDTVLRTVGGSMAGGETIYVADSATARALAPAARRAGIALAMAPARVWCEDHARSGRPVGTVVSLRLERVHHERAEVRWAATCAMTPAGETTPGSFGESGVYELLGRRGEWQVARSLLHLSH